MFLVSSQVCQQISPFQCPTKQRLARREASLQDIGIGWAGNLDIRRSGIVQRLPVEVRACQDGSALVATLEQLRTVAGRFMCQRSTVVAVKHSAGDEGTNDGMQCGNLRPRIWDRFFVQRKRLHMQEPNCQGSIRDNIAIRPAYDIIICADRRT